MGACGECGDGFFCEPVVAARSGDVRCDDARIYPAADGCDVHTESLRDLTCSDMHWFFVHALSLAQRTSSVKHRNKYIWRVGVFNRRWDVSTGSAEAGVRELGHC